MNRLIWEQAISKSSCPPWPCKACHAGVLKLTQNSLAYEETISSQREHSHEAWDPEWIDYAFTAWAQCTNDSCMQKYSISGTGSVTQEYVDNNEWEWFEYFTPKYCYPMPEIFTIPKRCPDEVSIPLRAAFSLFLCDLSSTAGKIRVALERLMDHVKIPSHHPTKSGKQHRIKLHNRIEQYAIHEPSIAKNLLAIKWLGNTAIHELTDITKRDILDAFEIIEHSLNEIIEQRSNKIAELAARLEQRHAPKD